MIKKCIGCGSVLQDSHPDEIGYVTDLEKELCERCFKIRHYNHYQTVQKTNQEYQSILLDISKTNDLVLLIVDLFHISPVIEDILSYLKNNPVLLVMTKRDVLPKSIYEKRLLDYMDQYSSSFVDKIMISSNKNYQFDLLYEKIKAYQTSSKVYVVGLTNAGKSTMLNQFMKNYTDFNQCITTSMQPSTTLDTIEIKIDDTLTFIDTPGILDEGNLLNIVPLKMMKKMIPKKEIKPISYQIKGTQYLWVENICMISVTNNDIIFYISNVLKLNRFYKKKDAGKLKCHHFIVEEKTDLVIPGLGFIKIMKKGTIDVYLDERVKPFIRKSFI